MKVEESKFIKVSIERAGDLGMLTFTGDNGEIFKAFIEISKVNDQKVGDIQIFEIEGMAKEVSASPM